jgi:Tol biopolymer transport system component
VAGLKDLNQTTDLYSYETGSKATTLVTRRAGPLPSLSPADESQTGGLSADGRYAVFSSLSPNLAAGQVDANRKEDVFLYDTAARTTLLVSHVRASAAATPAGQSTRPAISADGAWIAFFSDAKNLVPGANPNGGFGLYLFERATGAVTYLARVGYGFNPDDTDSAALGLSADGRFIVFTSRESDVVPGQQEAEPFSNTSDVFLHDRATGQTVLVSHSAAGPLTVGGYDSDAAVISADGRFVAFNSRAEDLVAGQTGTGGNVFLFDRQTGANTLVSRTKASALEGSGFASAPRLSGDGRFVFFSSRAGDLDPGVSPRGEATFYLYDRTLATYQRAGYTSGGFRPQIDLSADGRYAAFTSDAEILPGVYGGTDSQLYLYDRETRATVHVTRNTAGFTSKGDPFRPRLSADGRYLAFLSEAKDLIPGQISPPEREPYDLFLYDRTAGSLTLVSSWKGSSVTAAGSSYGQELSANGRQVLFTSKIDLVSDDRNRRTDVYLYNLDPTTPPGPVTIPPCILLDTRRPADAPALRSNTARVVKATGVCGVPASAKQVLVKVTSLQPTGKGNLRFYPGDLAAPSTGILRFNAGQTAAGTFDLPVSSAGNLTVLPFVGGNGTVGMVVEVDGYTP